MVGWWTWVSKTPGPLSGEYHGQQDVFQMFGTIPELTTAFSQDIHDVVANDDHGVVLLTAHVERDGKSVDAREVHVYHFDGDRVSSAWILSEDPVAAMEFWED